MGYCPLGLPTDDRGDVCGTERVQSLFNVDDSQRIDTTRTPNDMVGLINDGITVNVPRSLFEVDVVSFHLALTRLAFISMPDCKEQLETNCLFEVDGREVVIVDTTQRVSRTADGDRDRRSQHLSSHTKVVAVGDS